jgi:XTP/dITP diphosphohydrolase
MDIVLATNNEHKVMEINNILNFQQNRLLTLNDVNFNDEIIENGKTYFDNAKIKAMAVRNIIKDKIVIADDSGLEIDFFDGAPGLHSARFLNELTQKEKNQEVLKRLENVESEKRTAQFVSVVCCIMPDGDSHFFKGVCTGHISDKIYGSEGFGYDPIFIPTGFIKSFGVLSEDIKNTISHRAISFLKTKNFIVKSGVLS